jgi:hypothetical protein
MNCEPRKWYNSALKKVIGSTITAVTVTAAAAAAAAGLFDFLNMIMH